MKQVAGNTALVSDDQIADVVNYTWRRQPGETQISYGYFKLYLQMPAPRNLDRVAKQARLTRSALAGYSAKYKWRDRADAYDAHIFQKETERKRVVVEAKELEWLERREVQREQEWQIAQDLLDKVREMMQVPLMRQTVTERLKNIDPDGKIVVEMVIVNEPVDWSAVDITRFFEIAAKMARLATGMDTDRKKLTIDVSALTDDELEALANRR